MSIYSPQQEEIVFIRKRARSWQRGGLINDDQLKQFKLHTNTDLKQTNPFFRILLFLFSGFGLNAVVALFLWGAVGNGLIGIAFVCLFFAIFAYAAAEFLARGCNLYRYGAEEALVMGAGILLAIGIAAIWKLELNNSEIAVLCIIVALYFSWVYVRFGFVYSILIAIASLCVIPPVILKGNSITAKLVIFAFLSICLVVNLYRDRANVEGFRKARNSIIQSCILFGMYASISLISLSYGLGDHHTYYYILRYGHFYVDPRLPHIGLLISILLPVLFLAYGFKNRRRSFIDVGIVATIISMATARLYLGLEFQVWFPIVLGVVLVSIAILTTRWLNSGNSKMRFGFTAKDIYRPETYGIGIAGAIVLASTLSHGAAEHAKEPDAFSGGESGGAGATRKF